MRLSSLYALVPIGVAFAGLIPATAQSHDNPSVTPEPPACPRHASGLQLPPGFCATIFADHIGHARHLVVAPNGVVYVNTWSGSFYGSGQVHPGGFVVALQDTKGTGRANVNKRFGETVQSGGAGGTGIGLYKDFLYVEENDRIVRYALRDQAIVPVGPAEVVVSGLPVDRGHTMHPFVIDAAGNLFVNVPSATNTCQEKDRMPGSAGLTPCPELEIRSGIWRYDANKVNQRHSPAARYATGIRNADGLAIDPSGHGLYSTQHGRDQLSQDWPALYKPEQSAVLPAEVLLRIVPGGDYGWPECYYDGMQDKLVLAPEYGGDGGKAVGACAQKLGPVAAFPAHWAPDDLLIYSIQGSGQRSQKEGFPTRYRDGAFIAFHGSWNRAPLPQQGYNVVFQPLADGAASGKCEIFADGFAGATKQPGKAAHRPTGLAVGPDGALFVSDDSGGRIYRITYRGGDSDASVTGIAPCPDPGTELDVGIPATKTASANQAPADINADSKLPVAQGATRAMVTLGGRIYRGQVAAAPCSGCHGSDGSGTPLGPNLTDDKWLWSDGNLEGIKKTIADGVAHPKEYANAMPPMGGAKLTPDEVAAVSAYIWALSHRQSH